MHVFLRSKLVLAPVALVMIGAALAIPLALSGSHSRAAAPKVRHGATPNLSAISVHPPKTLVPVTLGHPTLSLDTRDDGRLLYLDDGTCPDSIDVYKIHSTGLVHVGNFPTGGCHVDTLTGSQQIDASPANKSHGRWLVYLDDGNGFVDSFPINVDGSLGPEASHLPNSKPNDVHISPNAQLVYVDSSVNSVLTSYSLGAGCVLTPLVTLSTSPHFYISFALINSQRLVTTDSNTSTIDTYALTSSGGISLLNSVPGQISLPDSVAVLTRHTGTNYPTDVFTGQLSNPPQAQGGQETLSTGAITFLSGSPAGDPRGNNGSAVFADDDHLLLVQGEQQSSSLGIYKIILGHPGSMAFRHHTPLASTSGVPVDFARMDNTLFVNGALGGDLEACLITSRGVTGCATAAIATNSTGSMDGLVLL